MERAASDLGTTTTYGCSTAKMFHIHNCLSNSNDKKQTNVLLSCTTIKLNKSSLLVDVVAHAVRDVGQAVHGGRLAAAALEVLHGALVVHQHRHHLPAQRQAENNT